MSKTVTQYWADFFGLTIEDLGTDNVFIVPHKELIGYQGAWIFRHERTNIISVPDYLLESIKQAQPQIGRDQLFDTVYLNSLFDSRVERFIGPAYQGCLNFDDFVSVSNQCIHKATPSDSSRIAQLALACGQAEWEHSSIDVQDEHIFIYVLNGEVVAAANIKSENDYAVKVGVVTHPSHRGKGFGRATVNSAVAFAFSLNYLVLFQTLFSNLGSVKIAESLGFKKFAQTMAIRFDP